MRSNRRKFKHEPPDQRKLELIEAALSLISENGVKGSTVRDIAQRARVTQGLIRHYFSSKSDLILSAYRHHMEQMNGVTYASASRLEGSAKERLTAFIRASLTPPVVSPRAVCLWASFLVQLQQDANMKKTHEETYTEFRDHLEDLIAAALKETGRVVSKDKLRYLATACNAVIDGLWLEGGALPDEFASDELPDIGLNSIGSIIAVDLREKVAQP